MRSPRQTDWASESSTGNNTVPTCLSVQEYCMWILSNENISFMSLKYFIGYIQYI